MALRDWLARGYAGGDVVPAHTGRTAAKPTSILETVRSVLMVGMKYRGAFVFEASPPEGGGVGKAFASRVGGKRYTVSHSPCPPPATSKATWRPPPPGGEVKTQGRVAAYAQSPDYHRFIWDPA